MKTVHHDVALHPTATTVKAVGEIEARPQGRADAPLTFDGDGLIARLPSPSTAAC